MTPTLKNENEILQRLINIKDVSKVMVKTIRGKYDVQTKEALIIEIDLRIQYLKNEIEKVENAFYPNYLPKELPA